jgi:peptidoglycan/LPS O-acetylase OafA/YrhL
VKYRPEIDGLRAVAVVPVIFHHAGIAGFAGGFVGVDVFFVISGYLITGLIREQMGRGTFTLRYFYERRARRILPALLFVMAVCIPFGWWLMLPDDLENFGQSLVATVFMGNNFLLWLTSGHWSLEAMFKPLVHTWSLGVEEQYYLLVPVVMLVAWWGARRDPSRLKPLLQAGLMAVLLVSLVYSHWTARTDPVFNFLMLGSRAWELAAGGLLAISFPPGADGGRERLAGPAAALGLLLIVASVVLFDEGTPHPALPTLLPVAGTALLIRYSRPDRGVGRLLALRGVVLVGLISYSAYLWHHPLIAFVRIASLEEPARWVMALLGCLAFPLAYASWRWVEQPCRDARRVPLRRLLPALEAGGLAIAAMGFYWHSTSGQMQRWPELAYGEQYGTRLNAAFNVSAFRFEDRHFRGDPDKLNLLIMGRSFARDFINAGVASGYFGGYNLVYLPRHDPCVLIPAANADLFADSDVIVFANGYGGKEAECILEVKKKIRELTDARLVVIGTKNFGWNLNAVMRLPDPARYGYRARVMPEYLAMNAEARAVLPATMYVDLIEMLTDQNGRVAVFTPERKLISQDRKHLTRYGAEFVGRVIFEHPLLRDLK